MSDSGFPRNGLPGPEPIGRLYVDAEAMLEDATARAERRERMLAALARESAPASAPHHRPRPRWAGWLAAAGVAGLTIVTVSQTYRPMVRPAAAPLSAVQPAPPAAIGPIAALPPTTAQAVAAPRPSPPTGPVAAAEAPQALRPAERQALAAKAAAPPSLESEVAPAPSATNQAVPAPQAPAPSRSEEIGGALAAPSMPAPPPRLMEKPMADALSASNGTLGAAAAAGRTAQVEALLARGVPVDTPDAAGDTPLMKAVREGHATTAAALRRHGASLDRRNQAGESARDLAAARDDLALDRALGLGP